MTKTFGQKKENKIVKTIGDIFRTSDRKIFFSKGDSTNWSYNLYRLREFFGNTLQIYRTKILRGGYSETLLKISEIPIEENENAIEKHKFASSNCSPRQHIEFYTKSICLCE